MAAAKIFSIQEKTHISVHSVTIKVKPMAAFLYVGNHFYVLICIGKTKISETICQEYVSVTYVQTATKSDNKCIIKSGQTSVQVRSRVKTENTFIKKKCDWLF